MLSPVTHWKRVFKVQQEMFMTDVKCQIMLYC